MKKTTKSPHKEEVDKCHREVFASYDSFPSILVQGDARVQINITSTPMVVPCKEALAKDDLPSWML